MDQSPYRERTYRNQSATPGLVSFQAAVRETDLYITAASDLTEKALDSIYRHRRYIENYIKLVPHFLTALAPLPEDKMAPDIVQKMLDAARLASVGPMAAVAGAVAECVGRDLLEASPEVIVENGGDIFLACKRDIEVGIFAGESPLSNQLVIKAEHRKMPLGICTSSGTVGPSLSFGKADAVCVISASSALADAAASQIGNQIQSKRDIYRGLEIGANIPGVKGIVIIVEDQVGAWGDIIFS